MQDECLNSRYVYEEALPVSRLVTATAESKCFKRPVANFHFTFFTK